MITSNATSGRLRQQAWHLLRTMWGHDIVPKVVTYSAAIRVRKDRQHWHAYHLYERCSATPSGRRCTSGPDISYEAVAA